MNELAHVAEFRAALHNYRLSPKALQTVLQTKLVLLVGPTGAGRNTLIDELVRSGGYYFIVGDTTREIRFKEGKPIEKNGREYWFRDEPAVLAELEKGEYIEVALIHNQQVSGWGVREVEKANKAGKIAVKEVTPDGARTVHDFKPDTSVIFNLPPNFGEWQRRLQRRGHMEPTEYKRRMESACKEFETALQQDYYQFVINDTIESAMDQVNRIVQYANPDLELQQQGRELTKSLLETTKAFIRTL
jgi:guanylate kinase